MRLFIGHMEWIICCLIWIHYNTLNATAERDGWILCYSNINTLRERGADVSAAVPVVRYGMGIDHGYNIGI